MKSTATIRGLKPVSPSSSRATPAQVARSKSVAPSAIDEELLLPTPVASSTREIAFEQRRKTALVVTDDIAAMRELAEAARTSRWSWDVEFAIGGRAGLGELTQVPYDVVVADLDMVCVSGAELLEQVRREHPSSGRVLAVSGREGASAIANARDVADVVVARMSDFPTVRGACVRVATLYDAVRRWSTQTVVSAFCRDRTPPTMYWELTLAMADLGVGVRECARIVETRPEFVERVLRFVNSASFGSGHAQRITSIAQAITFIGTELLAGLVLMGHVQESARSIGVEGLSFERMQRQLLLCARVARRLVADPRRAATAFTAALVHDVGKIVLAETVPERYRAALRESRVSQRPLHDVEKQRFGITHADIGACLLQQWNVDIDVVEAVAFHHRPSAVSEGRTDVLAAVHVADALVDAGRSPFELAVEPYLDRTFLRSAGILGELPRFRTLAAQELESVTAR